MFGEILKTGSSGEVDLTENLVAHYLLNNNSDDSHGTYGSTDTSMTYSGDVSEFNGTSSILRTTTSVENTPNVLFMSLWFRLDSYPVTDALICYEQNLPNSNTKLLLLVRNTGALLVGGRESEGDVYASWISVAEGTISTDTLYHVVIVLVANSTQKIFINAVDESIVSTTFTGFLQTSSSTLNFGADTAGPEKYFDGIISNVRIYSDEKDQRFITALYNEGYYPKPLTVPTTTNLVAHYPLTGTAEDTTGNHDGTEVGNIAYTDNTEFGAVVDFTGTTSYINCGTSSDFSISTVASEPFSWSTWFFAPNLSVIRTIMCIGSTDYNALTLMVSTTGYVYLLGSSNGTSWTIAKYFDSYTFPTGRLIHVTLKRNTSGVYSVIVEGTITAGTHTDTNNLLINSNIMKIGSHYSSASGYMSNGYARNTRIYDTDLTTQEMADIYNYEKNFRSIDIDDGLVAFYPLKNNSLDNYYNEYDGTDTSMSYDGDSGVFNGSTSSIDLPAAPFNGSHIDFSISFWMRISSAPSADKITYYKHYNDTIYYTMRTNGTITIGVRGTGGEYTSISTPVLPLNEFVLITSTNSEAGGFNIYLNTVLGQNTTNRGARYAQSNYFDTIGSADQYDRYFNGDIGNFRLYDKALSVEQIEAIYESEKGEFL